MFKNFRIHQPALAVLILFFISSGEFLFSEEPDAKPSDGNLVISGVGVLSAALPETEKITFGVLGRPHRSRRNYIDRDSTGFAGST